jgi:ammonium transporter, Amt family
MKLKSKRLLRRLIVLALASLLLAAFGMTTQAQDEALDETAQVVAQLEENLAQTRSSLDTTWVLLTGFLIFFMQTGFAMLEAGFVRQTSAVNILMENFIDAAATAIVFWAVGFGVAFGTSYNGIIGTDNFFLTNALTFADGEAIYIGGNVAMFALFFFQFAFAATASTIVTGSMAERTDFLGDILYTGVMAALTYPIVVHWVWGGGWLAQRGFLDFAGSTVVHTVGGVTALVGAIMLGPRPNRVFGKPPRPHNLSLATLGAMILWFGWYGFNAGSTLTTQNTGLMGLTTINTTLSGSAGCLTAMFFMFVRTQKWDLSMTLNGTLAGLVAITAGCAYVAPWAAIIIGMIAGILVILATDTLESMKIDDPVGAFPVHGICGVMGTLAVGFLGQPELTNSNGGVFLGGGINLLLTQLTGSVATIAWVSVSSVVLFGLLKGIGRLRIASKSDQVSIDIHEHGATLWPDVLPFDETPASPVAPSSTRLPTANGQRTGGD